MIKRMAFVLAVCVLVFNFSLKAQNLKGDPWIFQVYQETYNRQPSAWELNINNYNSGSWNNYAELKKYVQEYQASIKNSGLSIGTQKSGNDKLLVGFVENGKLLAVNLISSDGGKVIAAGGGNVVAAGGGNAVAAGGANFRFDANTAGVSFGGKYQTVSGAKRIIPASGKGALVIK
jgi:hypothetical protein